MTPVPTRVAARRLRRKAPSWTIWVSLGLLLAPGCSPGGPTGVSSGGTNWFLAAPDPVPGLHEGGIDRVTYTLPGGEKLPVVLWNDSGNSIGFSSQAGGGRAFSDGELGLRGRSPVPVHVEAVRQAGGQWAVEVTIQGNRYHTSQGEVFLLSTRGDSVGVRQVQMEASRVPEIPDQIRAFGSSVPEIATFFGVRADATPERATPGQ